MASTGKSAGTRRATGRGAGVKAMRKTAAQKDDERRKAKAREYRARWKAKRDKETAAINAEVGKLGLGKRQTSARKLMEADEPAGVNAVQRLVAHLGGRIDELGLTKILVSAEWVALVDHAKALGPTVEEMTDGEIIARLVGRDSTLGVLARAHALVIKKSQDYNQGGMKDGREAARADRDNYFPFGHKSYIHMLHTKVQRLISLEAKRDAGQAANFEGTFDTVLDVINYASFFGERIERELRQAAGEAT